MTKPEPRYVVDPRMLVGEQTFLLPFPPSVNGLYANIPRRGRVKTSRYRAWALEAGLRLNVQRPKFMPGFVRMTIRAVRPDNRRRDLANLEKAVSDLLVDHKVIEDDSLIESLSMEWVSSDMTGISVTLTSIIPPEACT